MRLSLTHSTTYHYDSPVPYGLQRLRLTPRTVPGQRVLEWNTEVVGGSQEVMFIDHFENVVELIRLESGSLETTVVAYGVVETEDTAGVVSGQFGQTPRWLFSRATPLTEARSGVARLVKGMSVDTGHDVEVLHELSARTLDAITYETGHTSVATTAEDAISAGHGVCQDHAHAFLAATRTLGYPARYVSGYLATEDEAEQDASHAWVEAWVDDLGWVGFDVANGISPDDRYVRVATGLDYSDAAPISGLRFGEGDEILQVTLQVQQQQ